MKINKDKNAFSILIAIFMVGFLLVLVIWMFNLMLRDMRDNRWSWNYLKSYAWAEWAMELWLLKIKEKGYWTDEDLPKSSSGILSFHPTKNNEPKINYEMLIATKDFSWSLDSWETVIIPLFSNTTWIKQPEFTDDSWNDIIWNIIGDWEWMSWSGSFDYNKEINYKQNISWDPALKIYDNKSIYNFLNKAEISPWPNNSKSYLMLFNKWSSTTYHLKTDEWIHFSKPVWTIISSVSVGKFRQNITTDIDNTEFLKMLKYSLYSK